MWDIPPLAMIDDILAVSECSVESVKLNALIQSKVTHKNLELGPDKCFKMHVGKESDCCPTLKINDALMLCSNKEKYLGDILTTDGRIHKNIEERYNKGIGIVNTISGLLKETSFGHHYFEMAVLFRNSMLLNGILCNSEVLYGVNKNHIETLESVDKYFWRKIFQCPFSTPHEAYYMETNTIPIKYVLMSRRLMYFWNILQMNEDELVKRVFNAQKIEATKNDWVLQIKEDLQNCGIYKSEAEIKNMKHYSFRKLVREKVREAAKVYLLTMREDPNRSKSKNLWPSDEIKDYLKTNLLSTAEKQLLFLMKTRMNNLKWNYKSKYKNNLDCSLCRQNVQESEAHLLQCDELTTELRICDEMKEVKYEDIYGSLQEQVRAVKLWKRIFKIRTWKIEQRKRSPGHQVHQHTSASSGCSTQQIVDPPSQDCDITTSVQLLYSSDFGY